MQRDTELAIWIKDEAQRLGFTLSGFVRPHTPAHFAVYQDWINSGRHASMAYLASARALQMRQDPRRLMPECQSILVLGINYLPAPTAPSRPWTVDIAAYARGLDYHKVLPSRLQSLLAALEVHIGQPVPFRIYTDTGPILERELAQAAGLGWIGRNSCLIHPRLGSYLILAEVLLGLYLPADPPFLRDLCGACRRCIDACPTGCIGEDRTLNAAACISFHTIENRSEIPESIRPGLGAWVFGCDICQQVCPWNVRFARPTEDPDFQPRAFLAEPTATDFIELAPEAYDEALRSSPLRRPRLEGLRRNAILAAANLGDLSAVPSLKRLLGSQEDESLRQLARWALAEIGAPRHHA
jgi:epoxyqueuosine reductase